MILQARKIKSVTASTSPSSICCKVLGPDAMILVFLILSFKPVFSLTSSLSSRGSLVLLHVLHQSGQFSSVQSFSRVWLFATPWTVACCPSPTAGVYSNSCPSSRWCHPIIPSSAVPFSCPQSFPASGSLQEESALHNRWPKYWSLSFSISPSNEY